LKIVQFVPAGAGYSPNISGRRAGRPSSTNQERTQAMNNKIKLHILYYYVVTYEVYVRLFTQKIKCSYMHGVYKPTRRPI